MAITERTRIIDIGQLAEIAPGWLMRRISQIGGNIPCHGPGRHSAPNLLERLKRRRYPALPPSSKEQRRKWNLGHQRGRRGPR